jgi:hypothetical protein
MIDPIKAQQHAQPFVPYFTTDEEQLKILRQGVVAWNKWRSSNPNVEVNLSRADLSGAHLIDTELCGATLTGSSVYGASVWNIKVDERTKQQNLVMTDRGEPVITVDDIEVAQFVLTCCLRIKRSVRPSTRSPPKRY